MRFGKKIRNDAGTKSELAFKIMSWHTISGLMIVSQIGILAVSCVGSIFPATDIFLSIVGTCAEIIAGLYGITMAGYTFFLSRIDALCSSDMTLDYVVASIKKRFKYLIWFITLNVLMTLTISIILMYAPVPTNDDHVFFYRLFCNEFLLSTFFSIVLILYYSVLVIDPNCISKEAAKLKKRISRPAGIPGNASEFIALYDRIETRCNAMVSQPVLRQVQENKGKHFELTLELIEERKLLPLPVIADLYRIHRYYECMINTSPVSATQEMCQLAHRAAKYLEGTQIKL